MKSESTTTGIKSLVSKVAQDMETLNQRKALEGVDVSELYSGVSTLRNKIEELVALFKEAERLVKKDIDDYEFFQDATSVIMWHSALSSVLNSQSNGSLLIPYLSEGVVGLNVELDYDNSLTIYEVSDNQESPSKEGSDYLQVRVFYNTLDNQAHLSVKQVLGGELERLSEHVLKTPKNFNTSCAIYTKEFKNSGVVELCKALNTLDYDYVGDKTTSLSVYSTLIYSTAEAHLNTESDDYRVEVESGIEVFKNKLNLVPKLSQSGDKALESIIEAIKELK